MSTTLGQSLAHPVKAVALTGSNSTDYLRAVFAAYDAGRVVASVPKTISGEVPGVQIVHREEFAPNPGWFRDKRPAGTSDEPAHIAFSSGTTGQPKAILLSHRALGDVVRRLNAAMGVDESIREYIGVPVNFSFGFARVRAVSAAGGESYLPPNGFDPSEIATMLAAGQINAISAVPTLWRVLLQNQDVIGSHGQAVRWIEIGSQYMSRAEKEALKLLFPNAKILQHYGLTEASRSTFLDISSVAGEALESVGKAVGETEVKLSDGGRIMIRGPHVSLGLITGDGIEPVTDADGWLMTNDLGEVRGGFIYFRGRSDDLVNCGGVKISPEQFENELSKALIAPAGTIATGRLADPLRGERLLVAVKQAAGLDMDEVRKAAMVVGEKYGLVGGASLAFTFAAQFPTTATGKLQRSALAELLEERAPQRTDPSVPVDTAEAVQATGTHDVKARELQAVWEEVLGVSPIGFDESFYDVGGDSLSAVTVVMRMQRLGIDPEVAKGIFAGRTISEIVGSGSEMLSADTSETPSLRLVDAVNAVNATRGTLVLWVIFVHWAPGVFGRLPGNWDGVLTALNPLFRMGTPGFALVFGLGMGAIRVQQYLQNRDRFVKSVWQRTGILAAGFSLLILFKFGQYAAGDKLSDPILPSRLAYSVLSFYVLMAATEAAVLWAATRRGEILGNFLLLALASLCVHEILRVSLEPIPTTGFMDLLRLLVTAKYSYFHMLPAVCLGAAVGYHFRGHFGDARIISRYVVAGAGIAVFGLFLAVVAQPISMLFEVKSFDPWHLIAYAGLTILLLSFFCVVNRSVMRPMPIKLINKALIATGMLSLPLFVGHEMVIPLKGMLSAMGVPETLALGIPMLILVTGVGYAYRKIYQIFLAAL